MDNLVMSILTRSKAEIYNKEILRIIHENKGEYWQKRELLSELPLKFEKSVVLENGEHIIGFIIVSQKVEETLHIHKINISSIYQKKGLGKKLLKSFMKQNENFDITLKVHNSNSKAITLYKKLGFEYLYTDNEYQYFVRRKKELNK